MNYDNLVGRAWFWLLTIGYPVEFQCYVWILQSLGKGFRIEVLELAYNRVLSLRPAI